jgi:dimethylglycine dehydrogenase
MVGRATSGGYGWRSGKSLALAMVRPDLAESPFDPENARLKA